MKRYGCDIDRDTILKQLKGSSPDKKLCASKVLDQVSFCMQRDSFAFTDFLDPASLDIALTVLAQIPQVCYDPFGGMEGCERQMVGISCSGGNPPRDAYPIQPLQIVGNSFSKQLAHRDVLGSLIGLGLLRGKLGDIIIGEPTIVFAHQTIADFIIQNLAQVGRSKVQVKPADAIREKSATNRCKSVIVASLRLDAFVGEIFRLSRSKAQKAIRSEKVFVNWKAADKCDMRLLEGDMITLRGAGRAKFMQIIKTTKKDRVVIEVELY